MVRHVALVLVGLVVLQQLRLDPSESIAAVKDGGSWPSRAKASYHPPPSKPALVISARPRKSC
jgi:hypothetical protein